MSDTGFSTGGIRANRDKSVASLNSSAREGDKNTQIYAEVLIFP